MLELGVGELEVLVDQIPNPLVRAREGMQRFSPDSEQAQKYSSQYIETLMEGGDGTSREFNDKDQWASDPATRAFASLPEATRTELGQRYLQWRFDSMTEETSDGALKKIATLAKEIGLESHISTIAQPYVNERFASLQEVSGKTDEVAVRLSGVAQTLGLVEETKEAATNYLQRRLAGVQNPTSTEDFNMDNLFALAHTYELPQDGELTDLYLATNFFVSRWGFSADKLPKRTEENEEQAMEKGWEIAQKLWENTNESRGLGNLINNEKFQARYSSDRTAKAIAKSVVAETLKGSYGIERARQLVDTYGLSGLKRVAGQGISANLEAGRYQSAQQIAELFGVEITDRVYDKARGTLERKASDAAKSGKMDEAIETKLRLKAFDQYRTDGLNVSALPEVGLSEKYSGKILLVEFQGRTFLRSNGEWHKDIYEAFSREVDLMGFSGRPREKGGAHIGFNDYGERTIYDKSEDFGECDKDVAKSLVQKAFPDQTIVARPARNDGW